MLTIARRSSGVAELVEHVAWQGAPFVEVLAGAEEAARRWRLERLCVDGTGLGAPLAARLAEALGEHRVERFVFGAQSKSELGYGLLAAANTDALRLYRDDGSPEARNVRLELRDCRGSLRTGATLEWGNPAGHDDFVVSLALCLRAVSSAGPARVARGRGR